MFDRLMWDTCVDSHSSPGHSQSFKGGKNPHFYEQGSQLKKKANKAFQWHIIFFSQENKILKYTIR